MLGRRTRRCAPNARVAASRRPAARYRRDGRGHRRATEGRRPRWLSSPTSSFSVSGGTAARDLLTGPLNPEGPDAEWAHLYRALTAVGGDQRRQHGVVLPRAGLQGLNTLRLGPQPPA